VTACFFGEGAVAEGEFHESLNLAALWQLPVLFICENNRYAMGTALERSESETHIAARPELPAAGRTVDGMDVIAVEQATRRAVDAIRGGGGPQLLECMTYRFRAHSMFDPELYRSKEEVEQWKQRGPIVTFVPRLKAAGYLDDAGLAALEAARWPPKSARRSRSPRPALRAGRKPDDRRIHAEPRTVSGAGDSARPGRAGSRTGKRCAKRCARHCARTSACF
jgi:hypothetical protein